jgi:hypothetical protein
MPAQTDITGVNAQHILAKHFEPNALDVLARIHARCIELAVEQKRAASSTQLTAQKRKDTTTNDCNTLSAAPVSS